MGGNVGPSRPAFRVRGCPAVDVEADAGGLSDGGYGCVAVLGDGGGLGGG